MDDVSLIVYVLFSNNPWELTMGPWCHQQMSAIFKALQNTVVPGSLKLKRARVCLDTRFPTIMVQWKRDPLETKLIFQGTIFHWTSRNTGIPQQPRHFLASVMSSVIRPGRDQVPGDLDLHVRCLEKIQHQYPNGGFSWWFTMVESVKNHLKQIQVELKEYVCFMWRPCHKQGRWWTSTRAKIKTCELKMNSSESLKIPKNPPESVRILKNPQEFPNHPQEFPNHPQISPRMNPSMRSKMPQQLQVKHVDSS